MNTPVHTVILEVTSGDFDLQSIKRCLRDDRAHARSACDAKGNTLLHYAALYDHEASVDLLLKCGADPHLPNRRLVHGIGETPFNLAAPSSPKAGRLMTLHWFEHALRGDGPELEYLSGQHQSSLIQYAAKWCDAAEVERIITKVSPFISNASGWTPLHAACAMPERDGVVAVLAQYYRAQPSYLKMKTKEAYAASYMYPQGTVIVTYPEKLTAGDVGKCRLVQDHRLNDAQRQSIKRSLNHLTYKA